jgi:hypothetical protein
MSAILDMLLALVIAGLLILLSLQMDTTVKSHTITVREMNEANSNLVVVTDILEFDLRKAGHGLLVPQKAIALADSNRIIFAYDQNPRVTYDSIRIEYSTRANTATVNPRDLIVRRTVNGSQIIDMGVGVTRLAFSYFNQAGTPLARPVPSDSLPKIRVIQIDMTVQNKEPFMEKYQTAVHHSKITPKNMLMRYGR